MKRDLKGKQRLPEEYEELYQIIKAKTARATKEKTEMANIFKAFVKKHEAGGRTVLIKTLKFYLDSLDEFDFEKILSALKEETQASKRAVEEMTKMEMDRIKNI
jgi:molecular chaperone GrpE (heat shock protein)